MFLLDQRFPTVSAFRMIENPPVISTNNNLDMSVIRSFISILFTKTVTKIQKALRKTISLDNKSLSFN